MRIVLGLGVLATIGIALAACSSSDSGGTQADGFGGGSGSSFGGSGAYAGGGGQVYDSGVGYGGMGGLGMGGSGGTGEGGVGGERNRHGPDAGADAEPEGGDADTCAALDDTKPATFFLSSDDSNSMASPVIARRLLNEGQKVPVGMLRTYEFLNYYNVGYAPAAYGTLDIVPEMRAGKDPGAYELQIGVASNAAVKPRRPMVITFVLDTSGSMGGTPIALERQTVIAIAGQLQAGDVVSMLTWNTQNAVVLDSHVVSGPNDAKLVSAANGLGANGGTNLNGGLTKGYEIAQSHFDAKKLNRVVLISDGVANVGVTDKDIIGKGAALNDGDGIYLVGVGVGNGVNDTLMDTVTDAGRGAYVYVDQAAEAEKMFGPRFDEVMDVAARAVQVELRMPWYMGIEVFYGEEYSTNPEEVDPQHLAPNDAMVFNQLVRPCAASQLSNSDPVEVIARWETPLDHTKKEVTKSTTIGELLAETPKYIGKAAAIIAYAEALKDPSAAAQLLVDAQSAVDAADPAGTDPELTEIEGLIKKAQSIY